MVRKINHIFALLIAGILLVAFGVLIFFSSTIVESATTQNELDDMTADLKNIENQFDLLIEVEKTRVSLMAEDVKLINAIESNDVNRANQILRNEVNNANYLESLFFIDMSEKIWANSVGEAGIGHDMSAQHYLSQFTGGNGFFIFHEGVTKSPLTGDVLCPVTHTMYIDGKLVGIVVSSFNLSKFYKEQILTKTYGETGYAFIFSKKGDVILHPNNEIIMTNSMNDPASVIPVIINSGKESGQEHFVYQGVDKVFVHSSMKNFPWYITSTVPVSELRDTSRSLIIRISITSVIIGAIILLVLLFFTNRFLIRRIINLEKNMVIVSNGDLTIRVNKSGNDEITSIYTNFNTMLNSFSTFLGRVQNGLKTIQGTTRNLNDNVTESAAATEQINSNINNFKMQIDNQDVSIHNFASLIEEFSSNIDSLGFQIEEQVSSITESSAAVEEMTANISSISKTVNSAKGEVDNMTNAASIGDKTLDSVLELVTKVAQESEALVVANSVIMNMANQTNLLSMNAAIEAAHAGDAGKGFSVVADEIRKLAENSSEQSKTVGNNIKSIKESINQIVTRSQETKDRFVDINSKVNNVSYVFNNIDASIQEMNAGGVQVLEGLRRMNDISLSVSQGAKEMSDGNKRMLETIEELREVSTTSKNSVEEIVNGMEEISKNIQEIEEISADTSMTSSEIYRQSGDFKL